MTGCLSYFHPAMQRKFTSRDFDPRSAHGGSLRQGRRKLARPITPRLPMHVVFRSAHPGAEYYMLNDEKPRHIRKLVLVTGRRFNVRVHQYANAGDHLHMLIQGRTRAEIQNFLRTVGAQVATFMTGAKKGVRTGSFWASLAYSRLVAWRRDFTNVRKYIFQNELEATGVIPHQPRRRYKPPPE